MEDNRSDAETGTPSNPDDAAAQEAGADAGAPQPSPSPVRRLTRSSRNKVVAGVAGGLGEYVGIDPVLFRLLFILLALVGGGGLLLYLAGWLIIPQASEPNSPAERALSRAGSVPRWIGIALVAVALLATVAREPLSESMFWRPSILWATALIGIGIVLLQDERVPESKPPPGSAPPSMAAPAPGAPAPAPSLLDRWRRDHPPSPLGWFTLAAVLVALALAGILHGARLLDLRAADFPALALLIIGIGLLIGSVWGRARWLILLGLALVPFVLGASVIHLPLRGDVGTFYLRPDSADELSDGFELLAGEMTLDLTRVAGDEPIEIDGTMVAGELQVLVPRDVAVHVDANLDAGELWLFGRRQDGVELGVDRVFGAEDADAAVSVEVDGGVGSISVMWSEPRRSPRDAGEQQRQAERNERRNR